VVVWGGVVVPGGGVVVDGDPLGDLEGDGLGDLGGDGLGEGDGDGEAEESVGIPTKCTGFAWLPGVRNARTCTAIAPTSSTSPATFRSPVSRRSPNQTTSAPATPTKSPMTLFIPAEST
jgi:hypothetical protein